MLRTGKQVWEASAKRQALGIRQEELDFHIQRYTILITQSAILTGFSFESIVHLDVPPGTDWRLSSWFFASLSLSVMFSMYVVVCGSCLVVLGQQMALLGADGDSLERAVNHLRVRRFVIFLSGFLGLAAIISAGAALAWIKMGPSEPRTRARTPAHARPAPLRRARSASHACARTPPCLPPLSVASVVSAGFLIFSVITLYSVVDIFCAIGNTQLVTGSTKFFTPNGYFDLATLQPTVGNPNVLASHEKAASEVV